MAGIPVPITPSAPPRAPRRELIRFQCLKNAVSQAIRQARCLPLFHVAVGRPEDLMCIRMATTGNHWSREQARTA